MGANVDHEVDSGKPALKILLDKYEFYQGDLIKGVLKLKSSNFLKNGVIKYYIINQEFYSYNGQNNKNVEENKKYTIFVTSLSYPHLIDYSISQGIDIPFSIHLPKEIFPNFEYSVAKGSGCVRNFIKIEISELEISSVKLIFIKKRYKPLKSPLSFNISQKQSLLGIINSGNLLLSASYKSNCYSFFSKIPVEININNNSNNNIDINKINVQLIRKIIFKQNQCNNNNKKDVEFNDILSTKEINIYKTLDKDNNNFDISTEVILEENELLFNKYKIEPATINYPNIKDKQHLIQLIPDINSNLFTCEYNIKIECSYIQMFKTENVCLFMPLSLYHQEKSKNYQIINEDQIKNINYKIKKKEGKENNDNSNNNNISEKVNNKKEKIKEPNIYTNLGNDDWNTPTNDILNARVE